MQGIRNDQGNDGKQDQHSVWWGSEAFQQSETTISHMKKQVERLQDVEMSEAQVADHCIQDAASHCTYTESSKQMTKWCVADQDCEVVEVTAYYQEVARYSCDVWWHQTVKERRWGAEEACSCNEPTIVCIAAMMWFGRVGRIRIDSDREEICQRSRHSVCFHGGTQTLVLLYLSQTVPMLGCLIHSCKQWLPYNALPQLVVCTFVAAV